MTGRFSLLVLTAAASMLPRVLGGQAMAQLALRPPNATIDAEFIGVTSIREVADGRAIVTDGRDQKLYVVDFSTRRAELLGRRGRGPGEWLNVGLIYPTQGDSSILSDFGNLRWLLFAGAQIVGTVPPDHPAVRATNSMQSGVDRLGHVLMLTRKPRRSGPRVITRKDSMSVVFVDRNTGHMDTVATLRERPHRIETVTDAKGRVVSSMPVATEPNAQAERAELFNDGWLAVVRLEPLRVDWRAPNGTWTYGKPLPLRPEPVDPAERRAILQRRAEAVQEAKRHGLPSPPSFEFPTTLPVITFSASPRQMPDGRLALARTPSASQQRLRYLVINRHGGIDGELRLGMREKILGFGERSVYVVATDEDDIQRLRRHPWP